MEDNIVIFNPIGDVEKVYELEDHIISISKVSKETNIKVDVDELNDELSEKIQKFKDDYNKVLKYLSKFWGKYVHLRFSYNINYTDTREIEPEWCCDYEANVLLYRYIPINHCLFGIYNKLNDIHVGGVGDNSIDLFDIMQGHRLEINEITEEEFIKQAENTMNTCLAARNEKIHSEDFVLTDNGYYYKDNID